MAFMRLGSKSEAFHREGQTWLCTTGLVSDVTIEVGDMKFHLHKFPLLSRSGFLEKLIEDSSTDDGSVCVLSLDDIPGGGTTFELVTKFCYGVKIELTAFNVVSLRCAAEYLDMTDDYGERNLVGMTETFLNEVFGNWTDSIKALKTCEQVIDHAEHLHIISRCVDSLAIKACADPTLFNWPVGKGVKKATSGQINEDESLLWNGISPSGKMLQPTGEDWWFDDASFLSLPLFKRLINAIQGRRVMKLETITMAVMYYTRKHVPMMNRQVAMDEQATDTQNPSEDEQKDALEEIVELLPNKKNVNPTKFLLRLLQTAMVLHTSQSSRENLERRIGDQLDQAALVDLLIPNMGYSETLYDVECVLRMIEQFVSSTEQAGIVPSPCITEEGHLVKDDLLTPTTLVANLVDGYLAEVAPDVNLKLAKFEAIAAAVPDYARPLDDGVYHAIDVYMKAHPWITDSEREHICRLMNCQKLSLEASTHAAQNERLPLRVIVQVLFFEQLRLRTSVSGWFFVSENLDNPENANSGNGGALFKARGGGETVRERVSELEKECMCMKQELQKLVRSKKSWKFFTRKLNFKKKTECCKAKEEAATAI